MKLLHVITMEVPNIKGLFALTTCNESSLLAYPNQQDTGALEIFDTVSMVSELDNR